MSARRVAFAVPLALLLAVTLAHLGARSGYYRSSRPDAPLCASFLLSSEGYACFYDGIPVCADVPHVTTLSGMFRGEAPGRATGIMDERPLVPFIHSLLGAGSFGSYYVGVLASFLAMLAACSCAVDLVLRLRGDALLAAAFGTLLAVNRGVGFYVGTPDVHMTAFAWYPVAAWFFESLAIGEATTPRSHVALYGLLLGVASLTYLGDAALLGFVGLYGLRRTPLRRLVAIGATAMAVIVAWRALGRAVGLAFDAFATHAIGDGLRLLVVRARESFAVFPYAPRDVPLGALRALGNGLLVWSRMEGPLAHVLTKALVPCFGWPLIALALAGLAAARRSERRLALALALPAIAAAWPMNALYDAPRLTYPATAGVSLAATFGLAALAGAAHAAVARLGARPSLAIAARVLVVASVLAAFALFENADVFGRAERPRVFHFGS